MSLKKFQAAFDALPDNANSEDLSDFFAGVAVSYMPPEVAVEMLLRAIKTVVDYTQDVEKAAAECPCPKCTAAREARTRH